MDVLIITPLSIAAVMAAGAVAGGLGALLGIGGGVFLVPFLNTVIGLPMKIAVATSLMTVIATSSVVSVSTVGRSLINLRLGMLLEVASAAEEILVPARRMTPAIVAIIATGEHGDDPGKAQRFLDIDRDDPGSGVRRTHDAHPELVLESDIGRETTGASQQTLVLEAQQAVCRGRFHRAALAAIARIALRAPTFPSSAR